MEGDGIVNVTAEGGAGFYRGAHELASIGVGYAGVLHCHGCALELGARDFSDRRGWCYVDGDPDDGPDHQLRVYIEGFGGESTDDLIDEVSERLGLTGVVLEADAGARARWMLVDLDEAERGGWAGVYAHIPKGCVDTSDGPLERP